MRYIVEQGQTIGSRQKIVLSGCSRASRFTRLTSVPMAHTAPAGDSSTTLMIYSVEPFISAAATTSWLHSGCTTTRTPGKHSRATTIYSTQKHWWVEHQPY